MSIHDGKNVLSDRVEREIIRHLIRGLSCDMPLCCVVEYAVWHVGLKPSPFDLSLEVDTILGHTGSPIVFSESANGMWSIEELHEDGRITKIMPREDEFIVVHSESDEFRPCRSCRARMIGSGTAEWHSSEDKVPITDCVNCSGEDLNTSSLPDPIEDDK